ncbi:hypothetical protein [Achromobacter aloeverae]
MKPFTEQSLRRTLDPAVTILSAFQQASRWRTIKESWRAASVAKQALFLVLMVGALVLGVLSVARTSYPFLVGCGVCTSSAAITFRYWMAARHPAVREFKEFERNFGLNYRFHRYLMFRAELERNGIDRDALERARMALTQERQLIEGRSTTIGPGATALLSVITSILTTLSTRDPLVQSGWTLLIMVGCVVVLFFTWLARSGFPTARERHLELQCFLGWYQQELAMPRL